ncbi:MAG: anti-sigma factor antagonist [Candidatus Aminicenantes bacterium]|nr:MAG: anti-sigma factor antagonist [Candidatus Aminicenantes bacterium]
MLRINAKKEGEKIKVLYLEGKICQGWIRELELEINKGIEGGEKVSLDFSKVSYVDEQAAEMLNQPPLKELEKRNCSLFIRTMLNMEG